MTRRPRKVVIDGLEELDSALEQIGRLPEPARRKAVDVMRSAVRPVLAAAAARAPQGPTGNLRRAMFMQLDGALTRDPNGIAILAGVSPRIAPHAHLVEYGHGGPMPAPAHPFWSPVWTSMRDQVVSRIKAGLAEIIREHT